MKDKKKQVKNYYLSLKLNTELFAVPVLQVLEVLERQQVTDVPNLPSYIMGMINFRGEILPVIEAREKFNMPQRQPGQKYVIVVLELDLDGTKMMLGLMADEVKDVLRFEPDEIKPVPEIGNSYNQDYLTGMIKNENGFLMVLNADRIFATEEVLKLQQMPC